MQAGRVVESGSHADLSDTTDGLYARLQAFSETERFCGNPDKHGFEKQGEQGMSTNAGSMGLIVVGAAGRMGQSLIRAIAEIDGVHLAGAIERPGSDALGKDAGELSGLDRTGSRSPTTRCRFCQGRGRARFHRAPATLEFADLAAQARIVHVIGTTGMDESHEARLHAASRHARIVKSGNMSLGVNLLSVLVRQAAKALNAGRLGHRGAGNASPPQGRRPVGYSPVCLARPPPRAARLRWASTRSGSATAIPGRASPAAIGFATLRGGSVIGEHSVILAGEGETVELSHKATDRSIFARGAVRAALWARGQKPGYYSMLDVLGLADH
jgi:4-hydroxy-tetrahydrodipicolinate reductase